MSLPQPSLTVHQPVTPSIDASCDLPVAEDRTDAALVRSFIRERDEVAFAELVKRFGPLVYAVSLRMLGDRHAAEDVFQATFFVLARDAAKLRRRESIASWMHGVALRLSKKTLGRRSRLKSVENLEESAVQTLTPLEEIQNTFTRQVLDEELQSLPERYREVLILHFLEEKTYAETAHALGVTVGVVEGRLRRGKRELQLRLARRGVGLSVAVAAIAWSQTTAQAALTEELMISTLTGGLAISQGTPFTTDCSSEAVHLATQETLMWTTSKVMLTACGLLLAATAGWFGLIGEATGQSRAPGAANLVSTEAAGGTAFGGGNIRQSNVFTEVSPAEGGPLGNPFAGAGGAAVGSLDAASGELPAAEASPRIKVTDSFGPREKKILEALESPVQFEFPGNPLSDVLQFISDQHALSIIVDHQALADEGQSDDLEVSLVLSEVRLQSALNLLLKPHNLSYLVEDEVLKITSRPVADETLETRIYDVRPLFAKAPPVAQHSTMRGAGDYGSEGGSEGEYGGAGGLLGGMGSGGFEMGMGGFGRPSELVTDSPQALVDVITRTTAGNWESIDGRGGGEISYFRGSFVVRQTQSVHAEIERLLNNLAEQLATAEQSPSWPAPERKPIPGNQSPAGGLGGIPTSSHSPYAVPQSASPTTTGSENAPAVDHQPQRAVRPLMIPEETLNFTIVEPPETATDDRERALHLTPNAIVEPPRGIISVAILSRKEPAGAKPRVIIEQTEVDWNQLAEKFKQVKQELESETIQRQIGTDRVSEIVVRLHVDNSSYQHDLLHVIEQAKAAGFSKFDFQEIPTFAPPTPVN